MRLHHVVRLALVVGLWMAPVQGVYAQTSAASPASQGSGGQHRGGMQQLLGQLNLSDAQKTQIKQIMQNKDQDPGERRKAIMQVLTPEQKSQLRSLMQARRQQHQGQAGPGGGPAGSAPAKDDNDGIAP